LTTIRVLPPYGLNSGGRRIPPCQAIDQPVGLDMSMQQMDVTQRLQAILAES
jgi:hypothetical protein